MKQLILFVLPACFLFSCKKENKINNITPPPPSGPFNFEKVFVNGATNNTLNYSGINTSPVVEFLFSSPIDTSTVASSILFYGGGVSVQTNYSFTNGDSALIIQSPVALKNLTNYTISITTKLKSQADSVLKSSVSLTFSTVIDSSDKFPQISDSALLTLVEQQTFNYFWGGADPTSGMAKERTSQPQVTTGGSGFGVMAMLVGVQRNFITRAQALSRIDTIVDFLTNKVTRYHGAFSHWNNGATGATVPFGTEDDGGDIVETAYMIQGLLCARQFFNSTTDPDEINLRNMINNIYDSVQWNWYRQNGQNGLTWNWSPDYGWAINAHVQGWCEALITYVLAASSNIDSNTIPKIVYDNGWAQNGAMKNGNSFYGVPLPLGPDDGGPLFFEHYSFLGINPHNLADAYAPNYWVQDTAHATINYLYCVANPNHYYGYSSSCWGLTASDIQEGYNANSPTSDVGVIAPTAAISSLPYTPTQSMNALRFFYYKLGDKIWGQYGFIDAFNLTNIWFDSDCLAIDQGPQIVMIENYRTGLLWNLFMSCPEVKRGMANLGFSSPNL